MPGFELIGRDERQAVLDTFDKFGGILFKHGFDNLRNGSYKVKEFQGAFARYLDCFYAQAVTSGTAALKVALEALGVRRGDEVITQAFTFVATVEAIVEVGAIPIITEIDETLNMDPQDLKNKISAKTKAIIPVHMYGAAADMDAIMKIAKKHNLLVLEDVAQAIGGTYHGKKLGTIGNAGIYSFDFGKSLTTGEGGMVATNEKSVYDAAREYSDHGHEDNPMFPRGQDTRKRRGFNFRMMELQAAIGLVQLSKLDEAIKLQKESKKKLKDSINSFQAMKPRKLVDEEGETADALVFQVDSVKVKEKFVKLLKQKNIGTKNLPDAIDWHFAGTWDHIFKEIPYYDNVNFKSCLKRSEDILRRSISIPIFIKMNDERIDHIKSSIKEIASKCLG